MLIPVLSSSSRWNSPGNVRCPDIWVMSGLLNRGILTLAMMSTKERAKQNLLLEKLTQDHYLTLQMESYSASSIGYATKQIAGSWILILFSFCINLFLNYLVCWTVTKTIFASRSTGVYSTTKYQYVLDL